MRIPIELLEALASDLLQASGVDGADAKRLAGILIWSDAVGRTEQGVQRLPILIKRVQRNLIKSPAPFQWSKSGATAHLDAADGFGHIAADIAVDRAIELANENALGLVTVSGSNYFGAAGYYAARIANAGLIGLVVSNSFSKVAAPGGNSAVLGTNPIAFSAPLNAGAPLLIDLATSALAGSDVRRKTEAGETIDESALQPFGGYKGFAIAIIVEVLAGALAGSAIGDEIGSLYFDWDKSGHNGHAVIAFAPRPGLDLAERMHKFAGLITGSGARLPGAERWKILAQSRQQGVELDERRFAPLRELAENFGISLPSSTPS